MSNSVKNYFEQTGSDENTLVLGGSVKGASGSQSAAISDPTGGATIDAEARAAIDDILAALRDVGIIAS